MRSVAVALYFWISFASTYLFFVPVLIFRLFGDERSEERFVSYSIGAYVRHIFALFGVRMIVEGLERIPRTRRICFVANHQGLVDIALIEAAIPMRIGFIAKKEIARLPLFRAWLRALHCITIERSNPRKAREVMLRGAAKVRDGKPIVIFPEGTRSRSSRMQAFRTGSMLLPIEAAATVVPLTVDGTYRLVEQEGRAKPGTVRLTVHNAVNAADYSLRERRLLAERLEEVIASGLEQAGEPEHAPGLDRRSGPEKRSGPDRRSVPERRDGHADR
jgi:1-acyl-sn-glycerol-3-phosphate acyltransferase